jgi:hypothetical protein
MRDTTGAHVLGVYGGAAGAYSWGGQSLDTGDLLIGRANAYVLWDNSAATLEVAGSIKATAGYIGGTTTGWAITAGKLSSANIEMVSGAAASITTGSGANLAGLTTGGVAGDTVLWAGSTHANRATAPFRVTLAGALTATNAVITGSLTAGGGYVIIDGSGERITRPTWYSVSGTPEPVYGASPNTAPSAAQAISLRDTAASWYYFNWGSGVFYDYPGNTLMRLYVSSKHLVPENEDIGFWSHYLDGVIDMPAVTGGGDSAPYVRRLWLISPQIVLSTSLLALDNVPTSTAAVGTYAGKVKVNIGGVDRWIPYYAS